MTGELVSFGIQKLWNLLSREHEQFQGVHDQVKELQAELSTLKSFLKDAYAKKHTREVVKNCIEEIKEIVFDAEDIIETSLLKDELAKNGDIKKRIRRFACILPERKKIASDMRGISTRISKVVRDMETYGVQQNIAVVKDSQPLQERREFARKYESNLVGLEANVENLVGYLVQEDDVQVVSMTGMGGLGKTTLARQAFNHVKIKEKFDRLVWVCVSQDCDRMNVWQTILRTLRPNEQEKKISEMTEATLQDELFQLLKKFKSLIVFDDIWEETHWGQIKDIFPWEKGSKVLLTSRNERVAGHGERYINFKPECLSDQDSWTLFQRIAMPRKDESELKNDDKEMEEMGKQMIKRCWGLPLAVRVLGGLLAEKYTLRDWNRVSENIGSHLLDDNNNSFNRVLSLSYEELPGYLKYCFLYLAHFPEDYEINVEELSYFWAAEGILRSNNGETIQDVGDSYIKELVRRNMVISERDNTTSRFETCGLHDLMRDLCLSKAKEENFIQIASISSPTKDSRSLSTSRRFVAHQPTTLDVEREINNSKVRSLVVFWKINITYAWANFWKISSISFTRLQLLRVLHLPGADFKGRKIPYSIGKVIHLRYLNLKDVRVSHHLPFSLRNLKLLMYLNLNVYGGSTFVPNVLMEMKELRYLALPRDMHEKTKLELSDLVNLETLINFSTEGCCLEDLRCMAKLRTLGIRLRGERSLETLSASIGGLRYLENLDIKYYEYNGIKEGMTLFQMSNLNFGNLANLEILKQLEDNYMKNLESSNKVKRWFVTRKRRDFEDLAGYVRLRHQENIVGAKGTKEWRTLFEFTNLQHLNLSINIPLLSDELQFPSRLTSLALWKSCLEEDPMPILEKLGQLKELYIRTGSFCGRRMVCSRGGFPQLQKLVVYGSYEWEEWIVEEGSMPLLHTLGIDRCKKLKELPDGMRFITSLKNLICRGMGEKWEEKLLEGGKDYYKIQHIPSVEFIKSERTQKLCPRRI